VHLLQVRLGDWDVTSEDEPLPHHTLLVARVILHPEFDAATGVNDVALVFLRVGYCLVNF
jgi:hypothetical protein